MRRNSLKNYHFIYANKYLFLILILLNLSWINAFAYRTEHVVVVLIDGVRYTESLGDSTGAYCPRMTALAEIGIVHDSTFNDSVTTTRYAIPSTWMGRFHVLQDTTYNGNDVEFCRYPTFWEYARHDLGLPAGKAVYVTPDYGSSTWLPSFYTGYGPSFWPAFIQPPPSDDNNQADFDSAMAVLNREHPVVSYIYLPDTDHAGHSGVWADYIAEIRQADSLVGELWDYIQLDTIFRDRTTLIVTNDHGRHDNAHGGFSGHGDGCLGCRHVMLLGIGPDFISNGRLNSPRASIRDIATTVGELLGFETPFSVGRVLTELFAPPCTFSPGDANGNGEFNGLDVSFSVNYLKGGGQIPPDTCDCGVYGIIYAAADANGSCSYNGLDVTFSVNFLKGIGPAPVACPECPPQN
jgi:hypothetical protein